MDGHLDKGNKMEIETIETANHLTSKIRSIERSISEIEKGIVGVVVDGGRDTYLDTETREIFTKILIARLNTVLYKTKLKLKEL